MDSPTLQCCEAIQGFTYVRQTVYLQAKSTISFLYIPTQTKKTNDPFAEDYLPKGSSHWTP